MARRIMTWVCLLVLLALSGELIRKGMNERQTANTFTSWCGKPVLSGDVEKPSEPAPPTK